MILCLPFCSPVLGRVVCSVAFSFKKVVDLLVCSGFYSCLEQSFNFKFPYKKIQDTWENFNCLVYLRHLIDYFSVGYLTFQIIKMIMWFILLIKHWGFSIRNLYLLSYKFFSLYELYAIFNILNNIWFFRPLRFYSLNIFMTYCEQKLLTSAV